MTDEATGPAVAHEVPTGFVGQPVPIKVSATCGGTQQSCSARLFWRTTPITGANALLDGVADVGWQQVELARGAETQLEQLALRDKLLPEPLHVLHHQACHALPTRISHDDLLLTGSIPVQEASINDAELC